MRKNTQERAKCRVNRVIENTQVAINIAFRICYAHCLRAVTGASKVPGEPGDQGTEGFSAEECEFGAQKCVFYVNSHGRQIT